MGIHCITPTSKYASLQIRQHVFKQRILRSKSVRTNFSRLYNQCPMLRCCLLQFLARQAVRSQDRLPTHPAGSAIQAYIHIIFVHSICIYIFIFAPGSILLLLGMVIPTLIGNPYNGCVNPYCKFDDHRYHRKAMGV